MTALATKLIEHEKLEQQLIEIRERLESLEQDEELQFELQFKSRLSELMSLYEKNPADIALTLGLELAENAAVAPKSTVKRTVSKKDPVAKKASKPKARRYKQRKINVYINPHTNERVEVTNRYSPTLYQWRKKWGNTTVKGWLQPQETPELAPKISNDSGPIMINGQAFDHSAPPMKDDDFHYTPLDDDFSVLF